MIISQNINPFLVSGYISPFYFCNRSNETKKLIRNAQNGINTTLLSIRRMGKTGLLYHTIYQLQKSKKGLGIYVDIFDTDNFADFINRIATAVMRAVPEKNPFWKKISAFIKQLRPTISYDELSGQPEVTLDYARPKQYEHTLQTIFTFLEAEKRLIVIAVDEFQQIIKYPEKNTEAILRTHIQHLKYVRFIFSGSSPHLLAEMFHNSKRPFFASTQSIELKEILASDYGNFITKLFVNSKRKIEPQAVAAIIEFTRLHTYYTQALCNKLYSTSVKLITHELVRIESYKLLKDNEVIYFQYRTMLTPNQWQMLIAIAKEGTMLQPTAKHIAKKYNLGPSSIIQRSIESLLAKEMIYIRINNNEKEYCVYDCFLARWLELK